MAVVAHGEVDPRDVEHVRGADLVVAADGGTAHLARWGIVPGVVVGDLDSLDPEARERLAGMAVEPWPAAKDKTDTEIAVDRALAAGATEIVIVGALGGARVDHALANTLLLAGGRARIRLVHGPTTLTAVTAGERAVLGGEIGDLVTLLAIGGDAAGIVTEGLRYPLRGETLALGSSRGVSNEVTAAAAAVSVGSGILLVVQTARRT